MSNIERIKAEIERYIAHYEKIDRNDFSNGELYICQELLSFIEQLEEEQPQGLDEAAEDYGKKHKFLPDEWTSLDEIGHIISKTFKAGAKWMEEQGVTKEAIIGMATKDIEINVSGRVLDELELGPGDKVIVQIRKK